VGVRADPLGDVNHAIIALAAAIAEGDPHQLDARVKAALAAGVPLLAVDELVLQSVLTVGWPRALVAAGAWRAAAGVSAQNGTSDLDYAAHAEWLRRGEITCATIYGDHYAKLRANVRHLHPALEAWMVTEGYGRTLSRPGLDLKVRELCTVAQTAVLNTPRQLHSHLLGALRAGASSDEIEATLDIADPMLPQTQRDQITLLWQRVRDAWQVAP
jgi:4-carboxymuconolactone decarboxylase